MKISEHANYLLNEYGRLQFDYAAYCKPYGESLRNEARNNLEEYIAELEAERLKLRKILGWAYDLDEYKDNPEEREGGEIVKECNDVATPIDVALRKRIAELEAAQRWHVVADGELPECEKDVLVFWGKASDGSKVDWFGTAWRNDSDDGKWCTDPIVPTHWMPLPQPPEVQE